MADYVRDGLRVKLEAIAGITDPGVLAAPYLFQLPPKDEFSTEHSYTHNTYETLSAGQHSRRGGVELRRSSWTSLVVDTGIDGRGMPTPSFVPLRGDRQADGTYSFLALEDLTADLIDLCESGSPFLYTAAHDLPPGSVSDWSSTLAGPEAQWPAVLVRIRVSQQAGEGDARYFDMDFLEYRDPVVGRTKLGRGKKGGQGSGKIKWPAFAVLREDGFAYDSDTGARMGTGTPATLTQLARHYYHDPSMARVIAVANGLTVAPNDRLVWSEAARGAFVLHGRTQKLKVPKPSVAA